ncbi:hypothetical protein BCR35DRAFT_301924, partial [Leucosporidium creatinivorum]
HAPTPAHLKAAIPADGPTAPLTGVLIKLGLFTLAMVVLPVGSYFVSRDWYFGDNLTGAGITAATVANLILVAFVVVALREDTLEGILRRRRRDRDRRWMGKRKSWGWR